MGTTSSLDSMASVVVQCSPSQVASHPARPKNILRSKTRVEEREERLRLQAKRQAEQAKWEASRQAEQAKWEASEERQKFLARQAKRVAAREEKLAKEASKEQAK